MHPTTIRKWYINGRRSRFVGTGSQHSFTRDNLCSSLFFRYSTPVRKQDEATPPADVEQEQQTQHEHCVLYHKKKFPIEICQSPTPPGVPIRSTSGARTGKGYVTKRQTTAAVNKERRLPPCPTIHHRSSRGCTSLNVRLVPSRRWTDGRVCGRTRDLGNRGHISQTPFES